MVELTIGNPNNHPVQSQKSNQNLIDQFQTLSLSLKFLVSRFKRFFPFHLLNQNNHSIDWQIYALKYVQTHTIKRRRRRKKGTCRVVIMAASNGGGSIKWAGSISGSLKNGECKASAWQWVGQTIEINNRQYA